MKKKILYLWIVILLTACAVEAQSTPTAIVETQSATATASPTRTNTPLPSATATSTRSGPRSLAEKTSDPTEVAARIEATNSAPTLTPVPKIAFCGPEVSSQGLLAFVQNDMLMVESEAGAGKFVPVARNALCSFGWSPDGNTLFYSVAIEPGIMHSLDYWLWYPETLGTVPVSDVIPIMKSIARSKIFSGEFQWSPDSKKILIKDFIASSTDFMFDYNSIAILDLEENGLRWLTDIYGIYKFGWMNSEYFYYARYCGSLCTYLDYYKYPQMEPHTAFSSTITGTFGISPDGTTIVNTGKFIDFQPVRTVEYLEVYTGQVEEIWELPPETSFTFTTPPLVSPDNQLFAFLLVEDDEYMLNMIDRTGKTIAQHDGGMEPITWKPEGGILFNRENEGRQEIVYWPGAGSAIQVVLSRENYAIAYDEFAWSENGIYLLLKLGYRLFLWDTRLDEEAQLFDTGMLDGLGWMPDSGSFYYAIDGILWRYFVGSGEIEQVTP